MTDYSVLLQRLNKMSKRDAVLMLASIFDFWYAQDGQEIGESDEVNGGAVVERVAILRGRVLEKSPAKPKLLGTNQRAVLSELLRRGGFWDNNCEWVFGSQSQTRQVLNSLAARDLVIYDAECDTYRATEAGAAVMSEYEG